MKNKTLLVFAMEEEAKDILDNASKIENIKGDYLRKIILNKKEYYVLITSVGLINSLYHLFLAIDKIKPERIINIGYVGAVGYKIGEVIEVSEVFLKDSDLTYFKYEDYYVKDVGTFIKLNKITDYKKGILFSSNAFTTKRDIKKDKYLVDMEGYSLAYLSLKKDIPITLIKVITDIIGKADQKKEYLKNEKSTSKTFLDIIDKLEGVLCTE